MGEKLDAVNFAIHYYSPRAAQQRAAAVDSLRTIGNQLLDLQLSTSAQLQVGLAEQDLQLAQHHDEALSRHSLHEAAIRSTLNVHIPGLYRDEREGL